MGIFIRVSKTDGPILHHLLTQVPKEFFISLLEQLNIIINSYIQAITPTDTEKKQKKNLLNAVEQFVQSALGSHVQLHVVGSTAYDVDSHGSDLDIVLSSNNASPNYVLNSIMNYFTHSQVLFNSNKKWPLYNVQMQLINSARVPVLIITTPNNLVCDISVNRINSIRHSEFFHKILSQDENKKAFTRLIKYWTKARKLPTMREGGLPGILWMLLALTFRSCSNKKLIEQTNYAHKKLLETNLNTIDKRIPLLSSLLKFFIIGSNRNCASKYILVNKGYCIGKNVSNVIKRLKIYSENYGVWDEIVSVENPIVINNESGNKIAWVTEDDYIENSKKTFNNYTNNNDKANMLYDSIKSKDLAQKVSCATWLVYIIELKRGEQIIMRLLSFLNDSKNRISRLPQILLPEGAYSLNYTKDVEYYTLLNDLQGFEGNKKAGEIWLANSLCSLFSSLFQENKLDRFLLPGCNEVLRQLIESEGQLYEMPTSTVGVLDARWGANVFNTRGLAHNVTHPFCNCCNKSRTDFALVLLHARVHLVHIDSICTDWTTWWTRLFLSRRDVRSIIHGTLYTIVPPKYFKQLVDTSGMRDVALPSSGFYSKKLNANTACIYEDERSVLPYLLMPVRQISDQAPLEILFHPCNFICRIRCYQTPDDVSIDSISLMSREIFFLESDEYNYILQISSLAAEAPWHSFGDHIGLTDYFTDTQYYFQKPADSCSRCNVRSADLCTAHTIANYISAHGALQLDVQLSDKNFKKYVRDAWKRWIYQSNSTKDKHKKARVEFDQYKIKLEALINQDVPIVSGISRTAQLVSLAINTIELSNRRLQDLNKANAGLSQTRSAPPIIRKCFENNDTKIQEKHSKIQKNRPNKYLFNNKGTVDDKLDKKVDSIL